MPYFTNQKNGKLDAIYSGRFAFIKPDEYKNIVNNFKHVTNKERQINITEKTKSLKEEFGHSIQFSKMAVGNALNGSRWIIRQVFIYFPYEWLVYVYYKLRFLWFCINYALLEDMYKDSQKNQSSENFTSFNTRALVVEDIKSCLIMLKYAPISTLMLIVSMPITIPIGYFLNKHFTVYAFATDKKTIVEYGVVDYTSSLDDYHGFNKFMRIIVEIVQHGYMINKRPWIVKKWVHIKLKTEKEMYGAFSEINKKNPAFPDFTTYINKIGAFAISWAGCGRIKKSDRIATALRQLAITVDVDLSEINAINGVEEWNNTLGFFYMHGN